jgi:hypothetical protein
MREQRLFLTRIEKFSLIALKNFIYEW